MDMGLVLPATAPGLGCGVAPPARHPWPPAWGMGYLLPAAAPDLGWGVTLLVAAPDLGRWLSPLGRPPHHTPRPDLGLGILLSHKKKQNWVIYSGLDEPKVRHME